MKDRVKELQSNYKANEKKIVALCRSKTKFMRQIQQLRKRFDLAEQSIMQLREVNEWIEREAASVMLLEAAESRGWKGDTKEAIIESALNDAKDWMEREFKRRKLEAKDDNDEQI